MNAHHSISEVSRIAGIPKDLLRMWERRYGYPKPARDGKGDRIYSNEDLDKLIAIRHLQEQGKRPGKLIGMDLSQLRSLQQAPKAELDIGNLVALLKTGDSAAIRHWFQSQLVANGLLRAFIHKVIAPATLALGEAWSKGEVEIYEEHLYTELMKGLVRQSLAAHYREGGEPRVMLTRVQGEQHSLGLLMVEALLRIGGAEVISFGTEMPFRDIREAASSQNADVIGLSFSCSFKTEDAIVMLSGLRQMIDPGIRIWVGGAAFNSGVTMPQGVELLNGLHQVEEVLAEWQRSH